MNFQINLNNLNHKMSNLFLVHNLIMKTSTKIYIFLLLFISLNKKKKKSDFDG